MSLKIVVLAKQVPDTRNVGKDAMKADGTINRAALPAIFNPEDLNALEQALRLKDEHPGSTVTILTMGPGRAAEVIREGLYRGADNGYLLTDVQMPAMNGFDLLKLLRASNIPQAKTIPVIAVTARSDMKREEFLQHGFVGSLHKPFTVNELLAEIGVLQADIATVDAAPSSTLNFSALTAFSGDDPDAAKSILESFVTETRLNVDRLRQALETEDTDGIAAMGHKMLPLFTLLGANELVTLLKELEASRGVPFDEAVKEKSLAALSLIEDIL